MRTTMTTRSDLITTGMPSPVSPVSLTPQEVAKRAAGRAAADKLYSGQKVGLGTGSTVFYFIERIIERLKQEGLSITVVSSSNRSEEQARHGGITVSDFYNCNELDVIVDGADEINPEGAMVKGGGGALLREKILAAASKEVIIVTDNTKAVESLWKFPFPVEIVSYGSSTTLQRLRDAGYDAQLRLKDGVIFVTDNGNMIADIQFSESNPVTEHVSEQIKSLLGVVETGFFPARPKTVLIGHPDGRVEEKHL